jgi:hypothetical protein
MPLQYAAAAWQALVVGNLPHRLWRATCHLASKPNVHELQENDDETILAGDRGSAEPVGWQRVGRRAEHANRYPDNATAGGSTACRRREPLLWLLQRLCIP